MRQVAWMVGSLALCLPWVSGASEPKVDINVEVVLASTSGEVIDPPSLSAMKEKFAKKIRPYLRLHHYVDARTYISQGPSHRKTEVERKIYYHGIF